MKFLAKHAKFATCDRSHIEIFRLVCNVFIPYICSRLTNLMHPCFIQYKPSTTYNFKQSYNSKHLRCSIYDTEKQNQTITMQKKTKAIVKQKNKIHANTFRRTNKKQNKKAKYNNKYNCKCNKNALYFFLAIYFYLF